MLDRLGLSMPSTHSGATEGPDLEKTLEGYQIMGIKYVEISAPRAPRPAAGSQLLRPLLRRWPQDVADRTEMALFAKFLR